ncbi:MAG: formate transporter FocA [Lentisphaerae bacterium]|nr:formate transporter FocA [Lentisphaerota bacterium]
MASRAEDIGVKKAALEMCSVFALAILAGAFIAIGAIFCTTLVSGAGATPYGVVRLLAGIAFSLGLILVVVGGAELFTGNTLIVMAWASRKVSTRSLLTNWAVVYAGNFVGAMLTAGLMYATRQYTFGTGAVGTAALSIANDKCSREFFQAIALGTMCNALVCMAVWMAYSARATADKILCIIGPITCFIAAGFEHSIANMYFIPFALFVKAGASETFWTTIGKTPADYPMLTWERCFMGNLLPVTIGNIIGGALLVGAVYWFVYLRKR